MTYITIRQDQSLTRISKEAICIIETTDTPHRIRLITDEETFEFLGKIKAWEVALGEVFIRVSSSCLVRKDAIKTIHLASKVLETEGNHRRHISKRRFGEVKAVLTQYLTKMN